MSTLELNLRAKPKTVAAAAAKIVGNIKLEVGKTYVTAGGTKVGPMEASKMYGGSMLGRMDRDGLVNHPTYFRIQSGFYVGMEDVPYFPHHIVGEWKKEPVILDKATACQKWMAGATIRYRDKAIAAKFIANDKKWQADALWNTFPKHTHDVYTEQFFMNYISFEYCEVQQ